MSKQDIEKRLGFAAQGVKETTRTSAKAAFALPKYRAFVYRGSPSNSVLVKATEWMDSASAAEDAAKQVVMSFRDKPGYNSNNYFADIAQETPEGAKTVKNYIRFSRPGTKAKMAIGSYKQGDRTVTVNGKKYEVLPYQMDFFIKELATLDTPEWRADVVKEYLRRGYIKSTASRPGVKIKFSAQFEVGRVYEHSFIGDYDAIVQWKVLSRTESTLTIKKVGEGNRNSATTPTRGEEKRVKINSDAQGEFVYPMGKFSMAPILRASKTTASRLGAKAKMALTIYTVGAKNSCYEALANLAELAKLASETKSGWGFHVTVMTDHVKSAMSKLESSPAQAGEYLERAIDTLGMLRKIDPVRLNDIQKGSLKQLIGYVAKSLRDARANIKVVTTASRPGAKAKMGRPKTVTVITMMSGTGESRGLFKVVGYDENGREFEYGMFAMRSMAEQKAKDVARWTDSKYISSRPSTKAKMGSSQVNDSATTADLIREAQRLRDVIKTSNREFDKTHLRQIKQELDKRGVLMPYGASEVLASRPGVKAKFEKEYVLWGLPKGETDRLHEKVLSTQAKTPAQMEDVKKRAAAAGWHSFRVQILDLSKPYKGFARSGAKAKMSATFIVAEAIFNAENAVRRGDNENARRWIKAAQDAMDETVVSTGMRSKLEQLVKRYKMSRPGVKAKA